MTWWQIVIGLVEFSIVAWTTDYVLYARSRRPERPKKTNAVQQQMDEIYSHVTRQLQPQSRSPYREIPLCRHCNIRTAFSIYPNGVGPMCSTCLMNDRYETIRLKDRYETLRQHGLSGGHLIPTDSHQGLTYNVDDLMHQAMVMGGGTLTGALASAKEMVEEYVNKTERDLAEAEAAARRAEEALVVVSQTPPAMIGFPPPLTTRTDLG